MKKALYGIDVPLDIFDDSYSVLYGDKDLAIEYCESKGCEFGPEVKNDSVDGFCIQKGVGSFVYIGRCLKDYNTIAHELMHAILNTTYTRNLYISDRKGEHELECYLVGYVFSYVLKTKKWFVWKNKKWVKQ